MPVGLYVSLACHNYLCFPQTPHGKMRHSKKKQLWPTSSKDTVLLSLELTSKVLLSDLQGSRGEESGLG